ncbi:hypothetical protein CPAR01_14660 [Colletotrichum paranaense]|uniref:Uncharacterized protein n=1 Tax=Colletotrichum paranaense TaxID=1914294 RepID=A0ABQ9S161_9PEZI|nr:uncharacterized protein CPAR01_14660 [Colletotrichum paranaense]KAK1521743.1 hypothetical protein CPAR01_14660 [Colletotrichum paranaense]
MNPTDEACQLYPHEKDETYHASVQACRICRQRFNVTYRLPRGSEDDPVCNPSDLNACSSGATAPWLPLNVCLQIKAAGTVFVPPVRPAANVHQRPAGDFATSRPTGLASERLAFDEMEGESIWMQTDWAVGRSRPARQWIKPPTLSKFARLAHQWTSIILLPGSHHRSSAYP